MTSDTGRPGVTLPEIARTHHRKPATVADWSLRPEWPAPIGKRGRYLEYDAAQVADVVRALLALDAADTPPATGRLLTLRESAERAKIAYSTARAYAARPGQWPEPDEIRDGVKLWYDRTIDARQAGRAPGRRGAGRG